MTVRSFFNHLFRQDARSTRSRLPKANLTIRKTIGGFSATRRKLPETVEEDAETRRKLTKTASGTETKHSKAANGVAATGRKFSEAVDGSATTTEGGETKGRKFTKAI